MLEAVLDLFKNGFSFKEIENSEYKSFKVAGMKFEVTGYEVEGIGRASVMNASGMAGLMKMSTVIINPTKVDLPLFSVDIIKAAGNDILFAEMYDTCISFVPDEEPFRKICEKYAHLQDREMDPRWYDGIRYASSVAKKVSTKEDAEIQALTMDFSKAYLDLMKAAPPCDAEEKLKKARAYSRGLIEHGGAASDSFLKAWGKEKTQDFFDTVLFG